MKVKNILLIITLISLATLISPAVKASCNNISCSGKISRLVPNGGVTPPIVSVRVAGVDTSPLNCTLGGGQDFVLKSTNPLFDQIYSLLLTAFTMQEPLTTLRIAETSNPCEIIYVKVDKI
ncbi:MAG: hypothetical protein KDK66_02750 [Deltaproteobacteria bacterium]|nr:hypothetical protein [Deltaproteobacteria bacterium]